MIRVTDKQYFMEETLVTNLNTICYNLPKDWDFITIITGSGMVRVGKSVLAQQVAYYVSHMMETPFSLKNIVFSGDELIKVAKECPKHSAIIYDEAKAELDAKKTMASISIKLTDFFSKCGMLNHFMILVLPDFFELNKRIAVNRSNNLLNVFITHTKVHSKKFGDVLEYQRGYFEFYGRSQKRNFWLEAKMKKSEDYNIGMRHRNYWGDFDNFWIVDREEYNKKKMKYLSSTSSEDKSSLLKNDRDSIILNMSKQGLSCSEIGKYCGYTRQRIQQILADVKEID